MGELLRTLPTLAGSRLLGLVVLAEATIDRRANQGVDDRIATAEEALPERHAAAPAGVSAGAGGFGKLPSSAARTMALVSVGKSFERIHCR